MTQRWKASAAERVVIPEVPAPALRRSRVEKSTIYFIQRGDSGPVKIGISRNVQSRLKTLQISCPEPLFVRLTVRGTSEDERGFHREFAAHRLSGEWFAPEILAPALEAWGPRAVAI